MSLARNLGTFAANVNSSGTATSAASLTAANFTVAQSSTNLLFQYNGSTIFTVSSTGVLTLANNITFSDSTTQTSGVGIKAGGVVYENGQTINSNYTMTSNKNGVSAGPITIADGVTVTIPDNSSWSIV